MAQLAYMSIEALAKAAAELGPPQAVFIRISGGGEVLGGTNPAQPSHRLDFAAERFRPNGVTPAGPVPWQQQPITNRTDEPGRTSGLFTVEIAGKAFTYKSLKSLLMHTLAALEAERPGTLERLGRIKGRTRRIVARSRSDLFDRRHLADKHAVEIAGGWWVNTNNSKDQVRRWLQHAAREAGLSWGRDFRVGF